jgi:hypothetical protein
MESLLDNGYLADPRLPPLGHIPGSDHRLATRTELAGFAPSSSFSIGKRGGLGTGSSFVRFAATPCRA